MERSKFDFFDASNVIKNCSDSNRFQVWYVHENGDAKRYARHRFLDLGDSGIYCKSFVRVSKNTDPYKPRTGVKRLDIVERNDGGAAVVQYGWGTAQIGPDVLFYGDLSNSLWWLCDAFDIGKVIKTEKGTLFAIAGCSSVFVATYQTASRAKDFFFGFDLEVASTINNVDNSNIKVLSDYLAENIPEMEEVILNIGT